jgi:hypothetical protein
MTFESGWPKHRTVMPVTQYGQFLANLFRVLANSDTELRHHMRGTTRHS